MQYDSIILAFEESYDNGDFIVIVSLMIDKVPMEIFY